MEWRSEPANCISNRAFTDGCTLKGDPQLQISPHRITLQTSLTTPAQLGVGGTTVWPGKRI